MRNHAARADSRGVAVVSEGSSFNLVRDAWIPAKRRSSAVEWIAPWQVVDGYAADPVVAIVARRPDFTGALTEFLIGLLSTAAAPADERAWRDWWASPPPPSTLRAAFESVAHAFDLDGPGPRFMQDFDAEFDGEEKPVASLLIDAPGEITLKKNTDLFIKRGGAAALSRAAAATALYTLQTYAPSGGQGHRTSVRGGGPLTTLVALQDHCGRDTLWGRIWPNIETRDQIEARGIEGAPGDHAAIFPWLKPTPVSDKTGREFTPADAHPLHVYWGMPRRIRLVFTPTKHERCALTDREDATLVRAYRTRNYGINYSEGWLHPLTPYYRQKAGGPVLLPEHAQPGGISYRHWLSLIAGSDDGLRQPARAVMRAREQRILDGTSRLVAFGYDMDKMKARGWIDSEMPAFGIADKSRRETIEKSANALVRAAEVAISALGFSVKRALYDRPSDAPGDWGFVSERFWRETEAAFFDVLHHAQQAAKSEVEDPVTTVAEWWRSVLERASTRLFDEIARIDSLDGKAAQRLVEARFGLVTTLRGSGLQGRRLFGHLRLETPLAARKRKETTEAA